MINLDPLSSSLTILLSHFLILFIVFLSFLFILSCTFRTFYGFKIVVSRQLIKDSKAALSVGDGGFLSFEFLVQGAVLYISSAVFSEFCGASLV